MRLLIFATLLLGAGCAAENAGIDPPANELYFPAGLVAEPTGRYLYVTNANSDLRYNSGTLMVLDLDALDSDACSCQPDRIGTGVYCDEECAVVDSVRVGSFAGEVRLTSDGRRLYFTTRANPRSVTWANINVGADEVIDCGQQRFGDNKCVKEHVVREIGLGEDGEMTRLPGEPFGLYVHETDDLAPRLILTHLSGGTVTVLDDCGADVRALDTSQELFPADQFGRRGAFAAAPRQATNEDLGLVYVTSRVATLVATVLIEPSDGRCEDDTRVVPGPNFSVGVFADGSDVRGLAFTEDGNRAFVADREPPSLLEIDTSLEAGLPRNQPVRSVEVCPEPSIVRADPRSGTPVFYVVCFGTAQVFVVDGELMEVAGVISTGRGPNALDFSPDGRTAYVTNFGENTIGIIDLDPDSPTYRTMPRRIGVPEPLR